MRGEMGEARLGTRCIAKVDDFAVATGGAGEFVHLDLVEGFEAGVGDGDEGFGPVGVPVGLVGTGQFIEVSNRGGLDCLSAPKTGPRFFPAGRAH